jgi:hypothetical protein
MQSQRWKSYVVEGQAARLRHQRSKTGKYRKWIQKKVWLPAAFCRALAAVKIQTGRLTLLLPPAPALWTAGKANQIHIRSFRPSRNCLLVQRQLDWSASEDASSNDARKTTDFAADWFAQFVAHSRPNVPRFAGIGWVTHLQSIENKYSGNEVAVCGTEGRGFKPRRSPHS